MTKDGGGQGQDCGGGQGAGQHHFEGLNHLQKSSLSVSVLGVG